MQQVIANQNWEIKTKPFKHCIVDSVFNRDVYDRLCASFSKRLESVKNGGSQDRNYDARIISLSERDAVDFFPLFNIEFLKLVSNAMGLAATYELDAAIHSHPPGSRAGWIHNDFNPGWFYRRAKSNEVIFSDMAKCHYKKPTKVMQHKAIQRRRYITMLFYLLNDGWQQSDCGETGIYSRASQPVSCPDISVSPKNNTMLIFECTPHSFHSFMSSDRERNSITFWLHRPVEDTEREWPYHEPVYW